MHEYLDCDPTDSPKMVKWAKYFVVTLFQIISCYIMTQEIEVVIETTRMLEWISNTFFDHRSSIYLSIMEYVRLVYSKFEFQLNEKNEMIYCIKNIVDKHLKKEFLSGFEDNEERIITNYGHIPQKSNEEIAFLKSMDKEFISWQKGTNWKLQAVDFIRKIHDEKMKEKIEMDIEKNNRRVLLRSNNSPIFEQKRKEISVYDGDEETRGEYVSDTYRKGKHSKNNFSISTKNNSLFTIKHHKKSLSLSNINYNGNYYNIQEDEKTSDFGSLFTSRNYKRGGMKGSTSFKNLAKIESKKSEADSKISKRSKSARNVIQRIKKFRAVTLRNPVEKKKNLKEIVDSQKSYQDCNYFFTYF